MEKLQTFLVDSIFTPIFKILVRTLLGEWLILTIFLFLSFIACSAVGPIYYLTFSASLIK